METRIEQLSKTADAQTQNFPDMLSLVVHRLAAERLRSDPQLLEIAKANLQRWLNQTPGVGAWLEWKEILENESLENILKIISAETDEGQRLRSSSPFAGLISEDERRKVIKICAEAKPF
ncbi:MAG: hypothetical protein KIS76_17445 [Pyrinomonadaceae bacterium]|nr:hypothetical protein [Pyrinomonadaceae bacterium]